MRRTNYFDSSKRCVRLFSLQLRTEAFAHLPGKGRTKMTHTQEYAAKVGVRKRYYNTGHFPRRLMAPHKCIARRSLARKRRASRLARWLNLTKHVLTRPVWEGNPISSQDWQKHLTTFTPIFSCLSQIAEHKLQFSLTAPTIQDVLLQNPSTALP